MTEYVYCLHCNKKIELTKEQITEIENHVINKDGKSTSIIEQLVLIYGKTCQDNDEHTFSWTDEFMKHLVETELGKKIYYDPNEKRYKW